MVPPDTAGEVSTGPPVTYFQTCAPVPALSAYTPPSSEPTYTVPPTTAGEEPLNPPVLLRNVRHLSARPPTFEVFRIVSEEL